MSVVIPVFVLLLIVTHSLAKLSFQNSNHHENNRLELVDLIMNPPQMTRPYVPDTLDEMMVKHRLYSKQGNLPYLKQFISPDYVAVQKLDPAYYADNEVFQYHDETDKNGKDISKNLQHPVRSDESKNSKIFPQFLENKNISMVMLNGFDSFNDEENIWLTKDGSKLESDDLNSVNRFEGRKKKAANSRGIIPHNERRYETCQRTGKYVDIVLNTGHSEIVIAILAEKCHEGIIQTDSEIWECEQHFTEISINGRLHNITTGCDIKRRIEK